ncbi:catalase-domain-containing protein [Aureobasidium namibiae CBS 147.97]|uniref:Catalase-domain-containing protein n=1 Tax=Aureobasidium namibiae CBS 147.97 TaxID=1043004 RepID=A0A074WBK2_9PEZI
MAPPDFNVASRRANPPVYTLQEGAPVSDPSASLQVRTTYGGGGLGILADTQLIETLAHFPRERIPERVVHAKAAGAWGEFEVTEDLSDITDAKFLSGKGKKTPLLGRISTTAGERGAADTVRDIRGWSMKLFTEEGNQDFVFNSLPVFFIRDPIKFPSVNRSHKRHPVTNIPDPDMFWDYHINNQEGIHALMHLFGLRGIPASLRNINAFGVHTYKLGKQDGTFVYVKWHIKPAAGIKNLHADEALRLAGENPDYHIKDFYDAIERGDFPTYNVHLQIMDPKQAEASGINIFDNTFTWPHEKYPLRQIGKITFNKNPTNYFQDVEQAAFSPSTMVPGIGPSADLMLHARMFSYPDAARYRLGPNYQQLPCNKPISQVYSPYQRDGPGRMDGNYGADPDYVRSSYTKLAHGSHELATHEQWVGKVVSASTEVTDKDFEQSRLLWQTMLKEDGGRENFLKNLCPHLGGASEFVIGESVKMFARVDEQLGKDIEQGIKNHKEGKSVV